MVMPRLVASVMVADALRAPPLSVMLFARTEVGAVPRLRSWSMLTVPPLITIWLGRAVPATPNVLTPLSTRTPLSIFVKPVVAVPLMTPLTLKVWPEVTSKLALPAPDKVIARAVPNVPVACSVELAARVTPLAALPRLLSAEMLSVPALTVTADAGVGPVKVFAPLSVRIPVSVLVRPKLPLMTPPIVPELPEVTSTVPVALRM